MVLVRLLIPFPTRIWPQRHCQSTLFVCSRITLSVSQQVPFERSNIVLFGVVAERSVRNLKQLGSAGPNAVAFLQGGLQIAALRIRHFLLKVKAFGGNIHPSCGSRGAPDSGIAGNTVR